LWFCGDEIERTVVEGTGAGEGSVVTMVEVVVPPIGGVVLYNCGRWSHAGR